MLKILLFITSIAFARGLMKKNSFLNSNDFYVRSLEKVVEPETQSNFDNLWVLELDFDRFEPLKLKLGTNEDEVIFDEEIGPIIETYERQNENPKNYDRKALHERNVKIIRKKMKQPSDAVVKKEIRKIVNKFALFTREEPDSHLVDEVSTSPLLTLYFKDKYSAMSVTMGNEQWNYFLRPPSPLPNWFYEEHPTEDAMYVKVPENVEREFYLELLELVRLYLNLPV